MKPALALTLALGLAACGQDQPAPAARTDSAPAGKPTLVTTVSGLSAPESVIHDVDQDVYFVTNINGNPGSKDGNGFISRMTPGGTVDSLHFVMGGRNGVTLNAPKGTAITGDTLWVTDLDAVRGFNRFTGAPLATIEFGPRARFLNDLALGPDGKLYASEMGVATNDTGQMSPTGLDNVFRIGDGHRIESIMTRSKVPMPNGITAHGRGLLIGSFSEPDVREWREDADSLVPVGKASGAVDGIGVLDDGRIVASSWDDSTVAVVGATPEPLITGVAAPADFEIDRKRHRVLIPQLTENQVVVWQLH
jgi:sugar lactone lactonase YvrE